MYCSHFGLHRQPFNNTPDPTFYYSTPDHEEALATLQYAAQQRKGFVMITGEIGAGKTLIGRMFVRQIEAEANTAIITHTQLTGNQLLAAICSEFELRVPPNATNLQLAEKLQEYLLEEFARDRYVVVLLDEAQNLPDESFEALRMLGNLEADDAKLLQVCILGQPELRDRFKQPNMKQLDQRLFNRFHVPALTLQQTAGYIAHRLAVAGCTNEQILTPDAIERVFVASRGTPRLINQICDNALLTAYGQDLGAVDKKVIDEILERDASLTAEPEEVEIVASASTGSAVSQTQADTRAKATPQQTDNRIEQIYGSSPVITETLAIKTEDMVASRESDRLTELLSQQTTQLQERIDVLKDSATPMREGLDKIAHQQKELHKIVGGATTRWLAAKEKFDAYRKEIQTVIADVTDRVRSTQKKIESLAQTAAPAEDLEEVRQTHLRETNRVLVLIDRQHTESQALLDQMEQRWSEAHRHVEKLANHAATQDELAEFQLQLEAKNQEALNRLNAYREQMSGLVEVIQRQCEGTQRNLETLREHADRAHAELTRNVEAKLSDTRRDVDERLRAAAKIEDIETLRASHSKLQAKLNDRIKAELAKTRQELDQQIDQTAKAEDVANLRETHIAEMSQLSHRLTEFENKIETFRQDVERGLIATSDSLQAIEEGVVTAEDLEQVRRAYADSLAEAVRKFVDENRTLQSFAEELEKKSQSVAHEHRALIEGLSQRLSNESQQLAELRQKLLDHHNMTQERIAVLTERFATRNEFEQLRQAQETQAQQQHAKAHKHDDQLQEHDSRLADQESRVCAQETRLEEQQVRVAEHESQLDSHGAQLEAHEASALEQQTQIVSHEAQLAAQKSICDAHDSHAQQQQAHIERHETRLDSHDKQLDTHETRAHDQHAHIEKHETKLALHDSLHNAHAQRAIEQQEQVENHAVHIDSHDQQLAAHKTIAQEQQTHIEKHDAHLHFHDVLLDTHEAQAQEQQGEIEKHESHLGQHDTALDAQQAQIQEQRTHIENHDVRLEAQEQQSEAQASQISDHECRLGTQEERTNEHDTTLQNHEARTAEIIDRIESDRQVVQQLIEAVSHRCVNAEEQINTLSSSSHAADEQLTTLFHEFDEQKSHTNERFESILSRWNQTQQDIEMLRDMAARADVVEEVREKQLADAENLLAKLGEHRHDLQSLTEDFDHRLEDLVGRFNALPEHIATAEQLQALQEANEQNHSNIAHRLDLQTSLHQKDVDDLNRRWNELRRSVEMLATTTTPVTTFEAAEQSITQDMSALRQTLGTVTGKQQQHLRTVVEMVQQISGRLVEVETRSRVTPVQIEMTPKAGERLSELTKLADRQGKTLDAALDRANSISAHLHNTASQVREVMQDWAINAEDVQKQSDQLKSSATMATDILQAMQRCHSALDAKINSPRWKTEIARGEQLAERLEKVVNDGRTLYQQLGNALDDFEHSRDEAHAWTQKRGQAEQLTNQLSKLMTVADETTSRFKQMVSGIANNASGLAAAIESARQFDETQRPTPTSAGQSADTTSQPTTKVDSVDWPKYRTHNALAG